MLLSGLVMQFFPPLLISIYLKIVERNDDNESD